MYSFIYYFWPTSVFNTEESDQWEYAAGDLSGWWCIYEWNEFYEPYKLTEKGKMGELWAYKLKQYV